MPLWQAVFVLNPSAVTFVRCFAMVGTHLFLSSVCKTDCSWAACVLLGFLLSFAGEGGSQFMTTIKKMQFFLKRHITTSS